jgi:hypothetical protein
VACSSMTKRRGRKEQAGNLTNYRIQYWDEFLICWVTFHRAFTDPEQAERFVSTLGRRYSIGKKYRIMEVTADGLKPCIPAD